MTLSSISEVFCLERPEDHFNVLARAVNGSNGRVQIIVLDHVDTEVREGIEGVVLSEEWREGKKLVPQGSRLDN
jgi:hypothetical protein